MAYTINSASDSRGDEDQYLADFNRNLGGIQRYKQVHGGDLEHAYQAVTGKPWPAGRSVKIKNGRGEMTKDRTVKSVLGKYVAPAAAAVAAPFVLPALFGGAAGAAGASGAATGATGAAGAAGGVGATAATAGGLSAFLKPALQYGLPAATGLIGQHMANSADEKAAGIQADYLNRALDVEKEKEQYGRTQYADYLGRLKPYSDAGSAAVGRASGLLTGGYRGPSEPTVKLRAPDGTIGDVPSSLADHYLQRGAQRV